MRFFLTFSVSVSDGNVVAGADVGTLGEIFRLRCGSICSSAQAVCERPLVWAPQCWLLGDLRWWWWYKRRWIIMPERSLRTPTSLMWCQSLSCQAGSSEETWSSPHVFGPQFRHHCSRFSLTALLQLILCFMLQSVFRALFSSVTCEICYLDRHPFLTRSARWCCMKATLPVWSMFLHNKMPKWSTPLKWGPLVVGWCGIRH